MTNTLLYKNLVNHFMEQSQKTVIQYYLGEFHQQILKLIKPLYNFIGYDTTNQTFNIELVDENLLNKTKKIIQGANYALIHILPESVNPITLNFIKENSAKLTIFCETIKNIKFMFDFKQVQVAPIDKNLHLVGILAITLILIDSSYMGAIVQNDLFELGKLCDFVLYHATHNYKLGKPLKQKVHDQQLILDENLKKIVLEYFNNLNKCIDNARFYFYIGYIYSISMV